MYICNECRITFYEPFVVKENHGMEGGYCEEKECCPFCGSGDFEEATVCEKCGRDMPQSQNEFHLCKKCEQNADEKWSVIQNFIDLVFDDNERAYINWKAEGI